MKVLVTGGSGLVGRFVVGDLSKHHKIEILDIRPVDRRDIPIHHADILDTEALDRKSVV